MRNIKLAKQVLLVVALTLAAAELIQGYTYKNFNSYFSQGFSLTYIVTNSSLYFILHIQGSVSFSQCFTENLSLYCFRY